MDSKNKRKDIDKRKLILEGYEITESEKNKYDFSVDFTGPKDYLYEGGKWKIHVLLPDTYPYKSPSIGFLNKIYHPNVDEASGSVCLDVINQTWSPLFDLVNIFNIFLPQLLLYPNPSDPLNGEAAKLLIHSPEKYQKKVKEYVELYAKDEDYVEEKKEEEKIKETESEKEDSVSELSKASVSDVSDSEEDDKEK